jgi:CubicO group peptidase (beta-lactamase class C family)
LPAESFDALGVGVIDFAAGTFEAFEAEKSADEILFRTEPRLWYDLASLTKVLTNSLSYFLKPELFDEKTLLCLSHRGGLPAWGLLPKTGWEEMILAYPVKESPTLYSDFSALRVMLELRKKNCDEKELCRPVWDKEMMYWLDLPPWYPTLQNGYEKGEPNFHEVHDPNARNLRAFCSHAGLFSTVDGLCRTLINYEKKTNMLSLVKKDLGTHPHRFSFGWDRVEDPNNTLAGIGAGKFTFGHLGFTGQSIWIDPDRKLGHVILSNATKHAWYEKQGLNDIRRAIGEKVWALK